MKIPKNIETAIIKAGNATKINKDNSDIVRNYLEKKNIIDDNAENLTDTDVMNYQPLIK